MITLTLTVFTVLMFAGMPISFVLLGSSMTYFIVNPIAPSVIAQRMNGSLELFPLLAVPFFVFAGAAMARGGIAERLYGFAEGLVGHWRGGLAQIAVINSLFTGAMSGSANADAAIDARTIVPVMRAQGYSNGFASAVSACSGVIAPMLPPSIGLIIYGLLTNTSIGRLFLGGIVPAFLIAAALMLTVREVAKRRGYGALRERRLPLRDIALRARHAVWALAMPLLLLFGLRIGWFTPTELGAVAATYALVVGVFVYGGFTLRETYEVAREATLTTANVMLLIAASGIFSVVLTLEEVPQTVTAFLLDVSDNKYVVLALINVLLLLLGTVMEGLSLMVILAPLFLQVMSRFGIDPVHFGVVLIINLTIGSVSPPIGSVLFTVCSITKCSIEEFTRESIPLFVALTVVLFIVTFVPATVLTLPWLLF